MQMNAESENPPRVAIVGGGASGVAVATHLAGVFDPALDLRVDLFDAGGTLGRGIAYSTTDDQHLLNVPAKGMSLYRDDMSHFQAWAGAGPDDFVSRARYGEYLQSALRSAWRRRRGALQHIRQEVVDVLAAPDGGWLVIDGSGGHHWADAVVLATGHLPPSAPPGLDDRAVLAAGFHADPWSRDALADLRPGEHVVCLGTGLTFVDVALTALAAAPQVRVTGVSRRGQLPSTHSVPLAGPLPPMALPQRGPVNLEPVIEYILAAGPDWRGAVDGLRGQTPEIWQRLSEPDREYFIRHLSRDWDVLRHRMAPQVAQAVAAHRETGRLRVESAAVYRIDHLGSSFVVGTGRRAMVADRIVVCTGPRTEVQLTPLGASLVRRGVARPGPFGIGYDVDAVSGELLGERGSVAENLFTIGPLRRGVLFESTAMPEISGQAQQVAVEISRRSTLATVA